MVDLVPHYLCFICKLRVYFALDAKFELIPPCSNSVRTCKFCLVDRTTRVKPGLPCTNPLKGPLGPSVSVPHFLVIPVFYLLLSDGLSMFFSTDGAFHHPSAGIMSCLFAYTNHEEFSWCLINHTEFVEWFVPFYFFYSYGRLVHGRNETFQGWLDAIAA